MRAGGLRLLVTVTFNPNQLRAHLLPLIALDEVESITLVADTSAEQLPKLRTVVPSHRARRLMGRAGAKLAVCQRLARHERFDWVLGFNFVPHGSNAVRVAQRAGTRSLYHMIGGEREWLGGGYASDNRALSRLPRPMPALERALLRRMRRATLVGTMGPRGRELLLQHGFDPARVVVIPPATDVERFRPRAPGERVYAAVTVAALIGRKRVHDLIEAAALLRARHPEARYAVAGDGPLRTALEGLAQARGVGDRFDFLGHVGPVEDVYADARVFVLPSEAEGLPIGILDAMAAGLPVVATDVGEIATVIRPGENGALFAVGDAASLADRLDEILSRPEVAERMGARARADAEAEFSVAAVADRYRQLLLPS